MRWKLRQGARLAQLITLGAVATFLVDAEAGGPESTTIRVCTRPGAGFFARDASGLASGLEYDILKSFASSFKREIAFDDAPSFEDLLARVEAGKCDIAASAVTITEERKKRFLLSDPYFPNRVVVVQKGATAFTNPDDLKGQRVAVVGGTLQARLLSAQSGVKVVSVNDDEALFDRISKGEAEALVCDSAVVLHHLAKRPDFRIAFPLGERSFFAFALPRNSALMSGLNQHLRTLVKNGEFTKMLGKHFGEGNAAFLTDEISDHAAARP